MTIKELNQKIPLINAIGTTIVVDDKTGKTRDINDKVSYAIKKLEKAVKSAITPIETKYNEDREDLQVEYASVDDKGVLLTVNGKYQYKKSDMQTLNDKLRKLSKTFYDTDITIAPFYFGTGEGFERLDSIDDFTRDELTGLLFAPTLTDTTTIESNQ